MVVEFLPPGVEDANDSQLDAKIIAAEFEHGTRSRLEEQTVGLFRMSHEEGIELPGKGEGDMKISNGQEFVEAGLQPLLLISLLAQRAVPITTGVINKVLVVAVALVAEVTMAT